MPTLTLVPIDKRRPDHPHVTLNYDGNTYDPLSAEFIRTDKRGHLYRDPALGYFRVALVGGCMVGRGDEPLKLLGGRYVITPLLPDAKTPRPTDARPPYADDLL